MKYLDIIKIVSFIIIVVLLLQVLKLDNLYYIISLANPIYLIISFISVVIGFLIYAKQIQMFMDTNVPFYKILINTGYAFAISLGFPSKIGEISLGPIMKKEFNISYKESLTAIVLTKISYIFILVAIGIASAIIFLKTEINIILVILICLIVLYLILVSEKTSKILEKIINKMVRKEINIIPYVKNKLNSKIFLYSLSLSFLRFLSFISLSYFALLSFNTQVNIKYLITVMPFIQLSSFIPLSINLFSMSNVSFIGFMVADGINLEIATIATILSSLLTLIMAIIFIILKICLNKKK